jgi:hypothetical protein
MAITERFSYALISAFFGALIGVAFWWLYGLAHSLNFSGVGIDPILRHWLIYSSAGFAIFGFLFREHAGDVVGAVINAVFHFESDQLPNESAGVWVGLIFIALVLAAIWFTAP